MFQVNTPWVSSRGIESKSSTKIFLSIELGPQGIGTTSVDIKKVQLKDLFLKNWIYQD